MATGRDIPPAEAARDGPSADVGTAALTDEMLARSRELRARSVQLRARGQHLRQALAAHRRAQRFDELVHGVDRYVANSQRRALQGHAQVGPATARDGLDRGGAALLAQSATSAQRAQAKIDRPAAESERELARQPPPRNLGVHIERAKGLRRQLVVAAAALASAEEAAARTHEELAGRRPAQAGEYRRIAEAARKVAQQARDIEHQLRS